MTVYPRVGIGWDVHPLVSDRSCVIVGVTLTEEFGPSGHSDGDVLSHAVVDALLGAAAMGDIGERFPDTDPRWKGVSGIELLERTRGALEEAGWQPLQVDAVIICDRPKIAPHREAIRQGLAQALGLDVSAVNVKGKRTEGLGGLSGGAGIGCRAIATVLPPGARDA